MHAVMVYVMTSRNFLLFIFEDTAEVPSSKNVKSLQPFSEELQVGQKMLKAKENGENLGHNLRFTTCIGQDKSQEVCKLYNP